MSFQFKILLFVFLLSHNKQINAQVFPTNPACVWNQAYVENFEEDKYEEILTGARECYVLVDPFHEDFKDNPTKKIASIKDGTRNVVGCYFSSGTCEDWRMDHDAMKEFCVNKRWNDWAGEYFIYDVQSILPHMKLRIDKMAEWGCDYTEFDNMDWCTDDNYRDKYGSSLGQEFPAVEICAKYNVDLCNYSKSKSMRCMAKSSGYTNDVKDYAGGDIMDAITFESYESDFNWWSKSHLQGFLDNDKPVVIVHYDAGSNDNNNFCDYIFKKYQDHYDTKKISYICESRELKKYVHYNTPSTECTNSQQRLMIVIKTDKRKWENAFTVKRRNTKNKFKKKVLVGKGKDMKKNAVNKFYACIDLNNYCYRMRITDSEGDGMSGGKTGNGKWIIRIDGEKIYKSKFEDGKKEIKKFGKCERKQF